MSPIRFLFLKLRPPPRAVLLVLLLVVVLVVVVVVVLLLLLVVVVVALVTVVTVVTVVSKYGSLVRSNFFVQVLSKYSWKTSGTTTLLFRASAKYYSV